MRNIWQEFKTFAFKGNMIDLAVGVIIGAAFGKVVSSLVEHIFMPLLAALGPSAKGYEGLAVMVNGSEVKYGLFIGAIINFLIVAAAIFVVIVKIVGSLTARSAPPPAPASPVVKECPHCLSEVPIRASKCRFCTSSLTAPQPV